jgi:trans-aconitate 2-methyltransferase
MWDAAQYLKYTDERSRPFGDLLTRVTQGAPRFIADLGCGPGHLTRTLAERWLAARVVGVDQSAEMLEQARSLTIPGRLEFVHADLARWSPDRPIDLIVSNAALQWVPDHGAVIPRLAGLLSPGGTLAVQMPFHFQDPTHLIIEETKADPRWRAALQGVGLHQHSVMPVAWYIERLHALGLAVDGWETTYIHVLTGEDPVLEWFKGSALRPFLNVLTPEARVAFLEELGARFKAAYPAKRGVTLLPFPRLFFVATQPK